MGAEAVAGVIEVKGNGVSFNAKGSFTFNLGLIKRDAVLGSNGKVQGYNEAGQVPSIKGLITDKSDVSFSNDIASITDATITLEVPNGKTYMFEEAWYSGDGDGDTGEGTFQLEFQAMRSEEI